MKRSSTSRDAGAYFLYGTPERDANVYHATGFLAPDPIACFGRGKRRTLLVNDLELGRARRLARPGLRVVSLSAELRRLRKRTPKGRRSPASIAQADVAADLLRRAGIRSVRVPASLAVGFADGLRRRGVRLEVVPEPFFAERVRKTDEEIAHVGDALRATEDAIRHAFAILRSARISGRSIRLDGAPLTAEKLRGKIEEFLYARGFLALGTIVACGEHGVDPHERGHGPLLPHRTIVIDVFPRSCRTLYYGDLTRTVVKGRVGAPIAQLFDAVAAAQAAALREIRADAGGDRAHAAAVAAFTERGFVTRRGKDGRPEGFIHGTGHGLGLELHEEPRLSPSAGPLPERSIVTVEPGLYYPGVGAVRTEDVALVTRTGHRLLSRLENPVRID